MLQLHTVLDERICGQCQTKTSCTVQHFWLCIDHNRSFMQASDFMNDEEGTVELCRQAAHWIFGPQASLLARPDQAPEHATTEECGTAAVSEEGSAVSEDRVQVRYFSAYIQLPCRTILPAWCDLCLGYDPWECSAAQRRPSRNSNDSF